MEPRGGTKACSRYMGHMTKMATIPVYYIYGKKLLKFSSLEPVEQFQRNLVCRIRDYGLSLFVAIITWVDLDLFFGKVKFCFLGFYMEKCDNDGFFQNDCRL